MFNDFMPQGDNEFWLEPDFFLSELVSGFVNRGGMELGITLFVHGTVITGTLVSEQVYLQSMSEMFVTQAKRALYKPTKNDIETTESVFDFTHMAEDFSPEEIRELVEQRAAAFANRKPEDVKADDDKDDEDLDDVDFDELDDADYSRVRHLHLKDPLVLHPQNPVSYSHGQVSILRLRLTAIDGWMIGKVTLEENDSLDDFPPPPPNTIKH
ncbi:MAG: hypothetical protein JNJ61_21675 [Anaerolineae bacterium]|nr:hypothetical protein [Anaerolineae bacterium]